MDSSLDAISITRTLAKCHGVRGAVLGGISRKKIQNARQEFAPEMGEKETALAMADSSLLSQGKAGLLVTDKRVYSSRAPAIELADITSVESETHQVSAAAPPGGTIFVDDIVVFKGATHFDFVIDLIEYLSLAARAVKAREAGLSQQLEPTASVIRLAGTLILGGQAESAVAMRLQELGLAKDVSEDMVRGLTESSKGQRLSGLGRLISGLLIGTAGVLMVWALGSNTNGRVHFGTGIIVAGFALACSGTYRLCLGRGMTSAELVRRYLQD